MLRALPYGSKVRLSRGAALCGGTAAESLQALVAVQAHPVQLVVESAGVAHGVPVVVPPPQGGGGRVAVGARDPRPSVACLGLQGKQGPCQSRTTERLYGENRKSRRPSNTLCSLRTGWVPSRKPSWWHSKRQAVFARDSR